MENNEDMNVPVNIAKLKSHPVTMPLMWVGVIFMAGWMIRPAMIAYMETDFFTKAEAAEHVDDIAQKLDKIEAKMEKAEARQVQQDRKIEAHISEFRAATAFQMVRGLEADLARHQEANDGGEGWARENRHLQEQVKLAHEYKDCIMHRLNHCDVIQKQIWQ